MEFSFHTITIDNQNLQMSLYASGSSYADGIIEYDFFYEPWTAHFFASSEQPDSYDSLRDSFIGPYRTETNPVAVERGHGSDQSATTQNHCGSLFHKVTLAPGETKRLVYVLGHGTRERSAEECRPSTPTSPRPTPSSSGWAHTGGPSRTPCASARPTRA